VREPAVAEAARASDHRTKDAQAGVGWFPALGESQVRRYLLGQAASIMGSWILDITLNLLVWELTRSAAMLGLLNFMIYGPVVLVTPLLAMRLHVGNARRISLYVMGVGLAVAIGLALACAVQALTLPLLIGAAAIRGVLSGMEVPSRLMLLTSIVTDRARVGSAIAMNTVAFLVARTLGPGIAGLIFEPLGPVVAFALAALGIVTMIVCVCRLHVRAGPDVQQAAPGGIRVACAFVRADGFSSLMLPLMTCMVLTAGAYQTLVPVLADRVFADTARWTGWFFAATGIGALLAALLLSSRYMEMLSRRLLLCMPWLIVLAMTILGTINHAVPILLAFAVLGFSMSFTATGVNAGMHMRVPAHARGGLIALFQIAFVGMTPFAQLLGGLLAQWLPVQVTFVWLAAVLLAGTAVLCGLRWHRLGRVELDSTRLQC